MTPDRISVDHRIMGGVPCIAGTRIPVATIVGLLAEGLTAEEVLVEYPRLRIDDIRAALRYAADAVQFRDLPIELGA